MFAVPPMMTRPLCVPENSIHSVLPARRSFRRRWRVRHSPAMKSKSCAPGCSAAAGAVVMGLEWAGVSDPAAMSAAAVTAMMAVRMMRSLSR
jgi:hypothetical protein